MIEEINNDIKVNIYVDDVELIPQYATEGAAGVDLRANIEESITIPANSYKLIPTGVYINLPNGYEAQIRSRSGLALKHGIFVLNSPGTIDEDFSGEIKVILFNTSDKDFVIEKFSRIAQMVYTSYNKVSYKRLTSKEDLRTTERTDGFGESGLK